MRRLIQFDIDGTLLCHTANPSYIPDSAKLTIRLLQEGGHLVAFNTARSFATAHKYMQELGIDTAVVSNGAHILLHGKTVYLRHMDKNAVIGAVRGATAAGCTVYAADEAHLYTYHVSQSSLEYLAIECGGAEFLVPLEQMENACKLDIIGDFKPDITVAQKTCVILEKGAVSLLPPGISKAQGLEMLANAAGIPLEATIAVGDSGNDICMLRAAGVGIAVGGAADDVKAAADVVAGNIEQDGIYNIFRQLGLI